MWAGTNLAYRSQSQISLNCCQLIALKIIEEMKVKSM